MATDTPVAILRLPARPAAIAPYIGQLGLALAALTAVPAAVSLATGELTMATRYAVVIAVLVVVSFPLARRPHAADDLQINEGLAITAAVFIVPPFLMAFPLMGAGLSYVDALFEAVSGITTTGLSTLTHVEGKPPAFLFARAWMQWYGGLGIIALVPLWLEPGPVARRIAGLDSRGPEAITTARHFAMRILSIYVVLSIAGFAAMWTATGNAFAAVVHTLSAVSTGGFSSYDNSLAGFASPTVEIVATIVSALGAVPLLVYLHGWRGSWRSVFADVQLRALLVLGIAASTGIALVLAFEQGYQWPAATLNGFVMGFSAQTTTGFSSIDIGALNNSIKVILIVAMATGGGLGSTAGGIKLLRVLVFFRVVQVMLQRTHMPRHAWIKPRLGDVELDEQLVTRTLALFLLFTTTIMISWLVFVLFHHDPMDSLFEVVSAVATVGLSSGLSANHLDGILKGVLCIDMWLGRLEIFAVLILLSPMTWRKRQQ